MFDVRGAQFLGHDGVTHLDGVLGRGLARDLAMVRDADVVREEEVLQESVVFGELLSVLGKQRHLSPAEPAEQLQVHLPATRGSLSAPCL